MQTPRFLPCLRWCCLRGAVRGHDVPFAVIPGSAAVNAASAFLASLSLSWLPFFPGRRAMRGPDVRSCCFELAICVCCARNRSPIAAAAAAQVPFPSSSGVRVGSSSVVSLAPYCPGAGAGGSRPAGDCTGEDGGIGPPGMITDGEARSPKGSSRCRGCGPRRPAAGAADKEDVFLLPPLADAGGGRRTRTTKGLPRE